MQQENPNLKRDRTTALFSERMSAVLLLFATFLLTTGALQAAFGSAANATICIASGLFTLLLVHLDRFEEIAGLGLKAKLRERLNEAEQIKANLRVISMLLLRQSLPLMNIVSNEPDGGLKAAVKLYKDLGAALIGMGVPEAEARELLEQIRLRQVNKGPQNLISMWRLIGIGTQGLGLEADVAQTLNGKAMKFQLRDPDRWDQSDIDRWKIEIAAFGIAHDHEAMKRWDDAADDMNRCAAAFDLVRFD